MSDTVIYWFRHDLRLSDLPGLQAASLTGNVIPVFIHDEKLGDDWAIGGASRWWLHHSLASLAGTIEAMGGKLILRRGDTSSELNKLLTETGASHVFASRQYQPWSDELERNVHDMASEHGAQFKRYPGTLLFEPGSVATGAGTPFKVFTPFWRACLRSPQPEAPKPIPTISFPEVWPLSDALDTWNLLPTSPNWAESWASLWRPGEAHAKNVLTEFLDDKVQNYGDGRDIPSKPFTSKLSPYLKFGEISPRQIWWAAQRCKDQEPGRASAVDKFLSEIGWREFCNHLVVQFPAMPDKAFNAKFDHFPWRGANASLSAWQRGNTGYPIVDAGMRELWQTGFMHNRVRMVVASFLTKHLLIDWRLGERWFWDTLLDADLASNACSWQWVAGSGADASPYFRIFNPVAQGEKFDKSGIYTRRWVPELKDIPDKFLHKPWEAPPLTLETAGIKLGHTYPSPIVDHKEAREAALSAYATLKALSSEPGVGQ